MNPRYKEALKQYARQNRTNGTKGEALLWRDALKSRKMLGYQFNRQFVIDNYIVDFVCRRLKLVIEIDGSSHLGREQEDNLRQRVIEKYGYVFLRFTERQVVYHRDEVINTIEHAVRSLEGENPP